MVPRTPLLRRWLVWLAVLPSLVAGLGCELSPKLDESLANSVRRLPAVQPPPNSVCLDVLVVERPRGDNLLGPELWSRVDQVPALESGIRETLKRNGFRLGVVGTNPPRALQQLIGEKPNSLQETAADAHLVGHRFFIPTGGDARIVASPLLPDCEVGVEREGEVQTLVLEEAECRFRLTVRQLQSGWAQLEFVPQVSHGPHQLRRVADEAGFRFEDGQRVETFYDQRFTLTLAVGEMALISFEGRNEPTLGSLFFAGYRTDHRDGGTGSEAATEVGRLLVIRLTESTGGAPQ
jgi:hypothetical protein